MEELLNHFDQDVDGIVDFAEFYRFATGHDMGEGLMRPQSQDELRMQNKARGAAEYARLYFANCDAADGRSSNARRVLHGRRP